MKKEKRKDKNQPSGYIVAPRHGVRYVDKITIKKIVDPVTGEKEEKIIWHPCKLYHDRNHPDCNSTRDGFCGGHKMTRAEFIRLYCDGKTPRQLLKEGYIYDKGGMK